MLGRPSDGITAAGTTLTPETDVAVPRNLGSPRQHGDHHDDWGDMNADTLLIRESEGAFCPSCGADISQWEHGISIETAVAAIFADPTLLESLLVRTCRRCGSPYDWDLAIMAEEDEDADEASAIAATQDLSATIREHLEQRLEQRLEPADAAERIRRGLGVTGILVEVGSDADRRLGGNASPG